MNTNVKSVTAQIRMETWRSNISDCNASGLTIKKWCLENDLSEASYYYWLKKIRKDVIGRSESLSTRTEAIVPMLQTLTERINNSPDTIDKSHIDSSQMTITTNNMRIDFKSNASTELVVNVLEVLKNV